METTRHRLRLATAGDLAAIVAAYNADPQFLAAHPASGSYRAAVRAPLTSAHSALGAVTRRDLGMGLCPHKPQAALHACAPPASSATLLCARVLGLRERGQLGACPVQ